MAHTQEALYSNKIFLNAALPLVKVIANDVPSLKKKFEKTQAIIQVSCLNPDNKEQGKEGMHFIVNNGEWLVHTCLNPDPDIELEFKTMEALNGFFKGNITLGAIPKIRGMKKAGTLVSFVMVLLKMAGLLGATEPPKDEAEKELLVKCYFYLLSSGISQLNKMGHAGIKEWTSKSPDRVYAWAVNGYPQISAYLRIKAGKSRAGRGEYKRAMPFFTLRFDSLDSALGILMGTADMLAYTREGKLIMDGAPEFGAQIGAFMLEIGDLAK
ncbi:MAG: hypothetical protein PUB43_08515 [Oscillospiraceae bacterium]|nr:hypothetical protein [Oscillospiraceae bacterium]